jgi:hypothetical protein
VFLPVFLHESRLWAAFFRQKWAIRSGIAVNATAIVAIFDIFEMLGWFQSVWFFDS